MSEFKVGDKVRHKSGGPEMLIVNIVAKGAEIVTRRWQPAREEFAVDEFDPDELEHVVKEESAKENADPSDPLKVYRDLAREYDPAKPPVWQHPYYPPRFYYGDRLDPYGDWLDPKKWYAGTYIQNCGIQHPSAQKMHDDYGSYDFNTYCSTANGNTQEPR